MRFPIKHFGHRLHLIAFTTEILHHRRRRRTHAVTPPHNHTLIGSLLLHIDPLRHTILPVRVKILLLLHHLHRFEVIHPIRIHAHVQSKQCVLNVVNPIGRGGRLLLLATQREMVPNEFELGGVALDLTVEIMDDPQAAPDGVAGASVGLIDDGAHGLGLLVGFEVADDLDDVGDAEELVRVEELALVLGREVGGKDAVLGAFPALVFARGACCLGAAIATTSTAHNNRQMVCMYV